MSDELKEKIVAPLLIMGIHLIDRIFGKFIDSVDVDEIVDRAEEKIKSARKTSKRFPRIKRLINRVKARRNEA